MKIKTYKQIIDWLFKKEQLFKFLVKRNAKQKSKLCARAELIVFNRADSLS